MRGFYTIILLTLSNIFMILAWYGHLRFAAMPRFSKVGLFTIILISWGIAFFEYCVQVPANRLGFSEYGGPFSMWQLKVIQEAVSLTVFAVLAVFLLGSGAMRWNHAVSFLLIVAAVYFAFMK
ncbi:MAG: DMT family protein [Chitinispirillales bacterium]|nr:DMT family protein [Chitinispirillales bacterium]